MSEQAMMRLITEGDVNVFFQQQLQDAATNQRQPISAATLGYISNMLTTFMHAEQLFEETADGKMIPPLALMYADAANSDCINTRHQLLQKLGDVALFISGLYAASLSRSLVDVDYYAAMGGSAYGYLAQAPSGSNNTTRQAIFAELARRFLTLIDILCEVGESSNLVNNNDVLRLYEMWQSTGSRRLHDKLKSLGIVPVPTSRTCQ